MAKKKKQESEEIPAEECAPVVIPEPQPVAESDISMPPKGMEGHSKFSKFKKPQGGV